MESKYDFFISYNKADTQWAEWIAWQLEEAGYTTRIQVWDFGAGSNFASEMDQAVMEAERTIAVLSPTFLKSEFCTSEWTIAFRQDPTGRKRKLLPVRVRECEPSGMLSAIDTIDLVGKKETLARDELLTQIQKSLRIAKGERAKPDSPIGFPGHAVAAERSQPRFPGALPPIWKVPYNRNPNFTGREAELTLLREQLISGSPTALTQAVSGLGGVGKTQLALEYIYRHAVDYGLVWWIRSEEPATLASDFANLVRPLGLPQAEMAEQESKVQAVRQKLGQIAAWLLVFDNASKPEDVSPYIPQGTGGHTIITSRNDIWQRLAQKLPVKTLSRDESIKFLAMRTGQEDKEAADRLAEELGDLPLALEQAGAYIEETGRELSDYLELFQTRRDDLLKSQPVPADYPFTVLTTWDLSMKQVRKESPEADSLLNLFSFLSPDDIPRMLLVKRNNRLPETIAKAIRDPLLMDKAVASLRRYSLIEFSGEAFSVHRLVQAVVREHLPKMKQESWCKAAVELVSAEMPSDTSDPRSWPICGHLAPHALAVFLYAKDLKIAGEKAADLLDTTGMYFTRIAEYHSAKPIHEQALEIYRKVVGENHERSAICLNNIGGLLQAMGDYTAAWTYFEQTLKISRKVLGEESLLVAQSLNNMGFLMQEMGDYSATRTYYEQALKICCKVVGEEDAYTVTYLNNMGCLLQEMGDFAAARPYLEKALEIRKKTLGKNHPLTLQSIRNLGSLLRDMGDYAEARSYAEKSLETCQNALGEQHPETAASLNDLGLLLILMDDCTAAKPYLESALEITQKILGDEHPTAAITLINTAELHFRTGKLTEAEKFANRAFMINSKAFGTQHPRTESTREYLEKIKQNMRRE